MMALLGEEGRLGVLGKSRRHGDRGMGLEWVLEVVIPGAGCRLSPACLERGRIALRSRVVCPIREPTKLSLEIRSRMDG